MKRYILEFCRRGLCALGLGPLVLAVLLKMAVGQLTRVFEAQGREKTGVMEGKS